jgi:hypothetical protein
MATSPWMVITADLTYLGPCDRTPQSHRAVPRQAKKITLVRHGNSKNCNLTHTMPGCLKVWTGLGVISNVSPPSHLEIQFTCAAVH